MKRRIVLMGCVLAALVSAAAIASTAEAHEVPAREGGAAAGLTDAFSATLVLLRGAKKVAAAPCVGTPASGFAGPYPCKDIDLAAYLTTNELGGGTNSDIWGWTDPMCNREYALLGMSESAVFVDVTIPEAPVVRGLIPFPRTVVPPNAAPGTLWREIKVYANHAYIVQDLIGSGVQIFDLTRLRLPAPAPPCGAPVVGGPVPQFDSDAVYTQQGAGPTVENVHTITINEATGFAYLNGSNTCAGAPHMIDLKPNGAFGPKNPRYVGCAGNDGYTHDAQCVVYGGPDTGHLGKEICVLYNEDTLTVVDVTNKSAPVQLERETYTGAKYTHQGWFTVGQRYILSDDELDEGQTVAQNIPTKTHLWDASDLDNLVKIGTFNHPNTRTADPNDRLICIDHNQYVLGNLVYQSNYACGLRIYSLSNIASGTLNEVAYFDTMPAADLSFNIGGDVTGDWSNYPYFASGTVVVSNITEGLFVLQPRLAPTAVKVASFRARQAGKRVTLSWRTASEREILGFNVFRDAQGRRVKVTKSLVPAKSLGQVAGARYTFVDRNVRAGTAYTYRLQVVSKDGRRAWYANSTVRAR
ncbi:MAG: choice-of-anchor B family protein [Gaiellaceae bacterium]